MFYTSIKQFHLENGQKKKKKKLMIPFWWKKTKEKQNSATIISVDGKGTVFLVKLKL